MCDSNMVRLTMLETTHLELIIVNLFTSIAEQVELQEQVAIIDKNKSTFGLAFLIRKEAANTLSLLLFLLGYFQLSFLYV